MRAACPGLLLIALIGACEAPDDPPAETYRDPFGSEPATPPTVLPGCPFPAARTEQGPFERFTIATHPAEDPHTWGTGLLIGDFDENGVTDLWVTAEEGVLGFVFDDEARAIVPVPTGLPDKPAAMVAHGGGAGGAVADIDGDGDLDVYLTRHIGWPRTRHPQAGENRLYRNDGPKGFTDVTATAGVQGCSEDACFRSSTATFGDVDHDGDLDLFVGAHGGIFPAPEHGGEPAFLYLNNGDGTFDDGSAALPPEAHSGLTLAGGFVDLNRDGDLDLLLANDVGSRQTPNVALWNEGGTGTQWRTEPDDGLNIALDAMGLAIGDLNGDLWPDFAVPGFREVRILLSRADRGLWIESGDFLGVSLTDEMQVGWGSSFFDIDNDGDLDMATQQGPITQYGDPDQPDALHINVGAPAEPHFELDVDDRFGLADRANQRGIAAVDLNQDGWLDLVKASIDGELSVYMARCGEASWLTLSLQQPGTANLDAVGAEVRVTHRGHTWIRTVRAGGASYGIALPPEVHFGLGPLEEVDKVEVRWPDGTTTDLGRVTTRQRLTITR